MTPTNNGIDQKLFARLLESIKEAPFYKLLGIELESIAPGRSVFIMEARREHTNSIGMLQGGLVSSLADTSMGIAVRSLGVNAVTVDLSIGFTAPARLGETLRAAGSVVKAGQDIFFTETRVMVGERLIAYCKGTFYKVAELDY
ncbi:MAG: PaaI family thioesterase [Syntrophomonadaceae bacterium]